MRKQHTYEDRLKYMKMLGDGYSIKHIATHYGICHHLLAVLWLKYQREGPSGICQKQHIRSDGPLREKIIRDIETNCLPLYEAAVKYDVSVNQILAWRKKVKEEGYQSLYENKLPGRPQMNMGRPRKKKPEEMTELERLRYENECLRTENALLKKVRALVEERNARLREIGQKPSKN